MPPEADKISLSQPSPRLETLRSQISDSEKVGRRLSRFKHKWRRDRWAYSVVHKGLSWPWSPRPHKYRPFFQPSSDIIRQFLDTLLEAGAIEKSNFLAFQGRLFSVPKKDSKARRVILDLSDLNLCIPRIRFKMT